MTRLHRKPKRGARSSDAPAREAGQWLTGRHAAREALRAGRRRLDRLLLREGARRAADEELVRLAEQARVPIEFVPASTLDALAEGEGPGQGVALRVGPLPELSLDELIDRSGGTGEAVRLVALDGVEDPQNVGALARVAESAGAAGMILTRRRAPGLSPSVARASAGAIEWLPVARVPNLDRSLETLQARGFWVVAAAPDPDDSLFLQEDRILTGNLVVVLGAEGSGIRPSILKRADHRVGIPMRGHVASLNVSTAGAVILYDLLRRAEATSPAAPEGA